MINDLTGSVSEYLIQEGMLPYLKTVSVPTLHMFEFLRHPERHAALPQDGERSYPAYV
jgi:hypothetical protein